MNLLLSIHRMAFREAPTPELAQLTVVKKWVELERQLGARKDDPAAATNRDIERALADMQERSGQMLKATERHRLDKLV